MCVFVGVRACLCLRQSHPWLGVCYINFCVFSLSDWISIKSSPLPIKHSFSLQATQAFFCFVTLSTPSVSVFSPPLPLVSLFPVFPLCSFLSVSLSSQLAFIKVLYFFSYFLLLPPSRTLFPLPFLLLNFFSLRLFSLTSLTGTQERFELTPVAAISVHLLASDGVELQANEPITVSVPLPPDSGLKENDHIPAWRFDPRLGMY